MSILLGDNFQYQAAKPLDARLKYDTVAAMKAVGDSTMYEGCLAYCVATDKTYQWKSTNTVDATLGKWRELSGGGHSIEDSEGTALTQRDTMQFGVGFYASDDSENEKTVVEPNLMTAADMDDVVTPLPSVRSRYHKYSTEEQIVGEWIDGKPIYEITVHNIEITDSNTTKVTIINIPFSDVGIPLDLEQVVSLEQVFRINNNATQDTYVTNNAANATRTVDDTLVIRTRQVSIDVYNKLISILNSMGYNLKVTLTIRYTKTTD